MSLKDKKDYSYYGINMGKDGYIPEPDRLVWNVFTCDFNSNKIEVTNVFDYVWPFLVDLVNIKKKYGDNFEKFAEEVRSSLMYYYWSKCEREIIIKNWVGRDAEEKVDVYGQIMINWNRFITYLWENKKLITPKKLGIEDVYGKKKNK